MPIHRLRRRKSLPALTSLSPYGFRKSRSTKVKHSTAQQAHLQLKWEGPTSFLPRSGRTVTKVVLSGLASSRTECTSRRLGETSPWHTTATLTPCFQFCICRSATRCMCNTELKVVPKSLFLVGVLVGCKSMLTPRFNSDNLQKKNNKKTQCKLKSVR